MRCGKLKLRASPTRDRSLARAKARRCEDVATVVDSDPFVRSRLTRATHLARPHAPLASPAPGFGSLRPARGSCLRRRRSDTREGNGRASGRIRQGNQTTQPPPRRAPVQTAHRLSRTRPARSRESPRALERSRKRAATAPGTERPRGDPSGNRERTPVPAGGDVARPAGCAETPPVEARDRPDLRGTTPLRR